MWHALYNLLLTPACITLRVAGPLLKGDFRERMGEVEVQESPNVRWIHCASVGELSAIAGLVNEMRKDEPESPIVISTMTRTGKDRARALFPDIYSFIAPLDISHFVRNALERIQPAVLFIVETEVWPNLIKLSRERGASIIIVNGRLSPGSLRRYLFLRPFFSRILRYVNWIFVQTDVDRHRFLRLAVPADRISVTGTMKSDLPIVPAERDALLREFSIPGGMKILVAGSVRPSEEADVLKALRTVALKFPAAYFVVAPRHLERAENLALLAREMGMSVRFRSDGHPHSKERILILDTIGELTRLYGAAHVSFVGGSLKPYGGHNLLEPARWGVPVLFGEFTDNCNDEAEEFLALQGGMRVRDWEELASRINILFDDDELRLRMGSNAQTVVKRRSGVSREVFEALVHKGVLGRPDDE